MRTLLMPLPLVLVLVGCSQVPKPMAYQLSYQQKMQAARHWEILAQDVASHVAGGGAGASVFVEPRSGVFGDAFTQMLVTELVSQGVTVAAQPGAAATLSFDVQMVRHKAGWPHRRNRAHPGMWTVLATGIRVAENVTEDMIIPLGIALDLWDGTWTTLPEHEVLITTSLQRDGQFLMRRSDLYYVNDADSGQYRESVPGIPKTLEVVAQ